MKDASLDIHHQDANSCRPTAKLNRRSDGSEYVTLKIGPADAYGGVHHYIPASAFPQFCYEMRAALDSVEVPSDG